MSCKAYKIHSLAFYGKFASRFSRGTSKATGRLLIRGLGAPSGGVCSAEEDGAKWSVSLSETRASYPSAMGHRQSVDLPSLGDHGNRSFPPKNLEVCQGKYQDPLIFC